MEAFLKPLIGLIATVVCLTVFTTKEQMSHYEEVSQVSPNTNATPYQLADFQQADPCAVAWNEREAIFAQLERERTRHGLVRDSLSRIIQSVRREKTKLREELKDSVDQLARKQADLQDCQLTLQTETDLRNAAEQEQRACQEQKNAEIEARTQAEIALKVSQLDYHQLQLWFYGALALICALVIWVVALKRAWTWRDWRMTRLKSD